MHSKKLKTVIVNELYMERLRRCEDADVEIMGKKDFLYQDARRWCIVKMHILICANLLCT